MTIAIPVLVLGLYGIRRHYSKVARRLRAGVSAVAAAPTATNRVVLYVESYALPLRKQLVRASANLARGDGLEPEWQAASFSVEVCDEFAVVFDPYRHELPREQPSLPTQ